MFPARAGMNLTAQSWRQVFPARAGMNRHLASHELTGGVPRAGGDEPNREVSLLCVPRAGGDEPSSIGRGPSGCRGVPRAGGDEPIGSGIASAPWQQPCVPRAGGDEPQRRDLAKLEVFPAQAGMNRSPRGHGWWRRVPRAGGDEPEFRMGQKYLESMRGVPRAGGDEPA